MAEYESQDMVTLLTTVYKEPEAHAQRMLWIARTFGLSTAPHARGYIRVEPAGPGKYTLDEEFLGMKAGGERKLTDGKRAEHGE